MRDLDKITAVDELLIHDHAGHMSDVLTEMWESWVTNEINDMAPAKERAEVLWAYKNLKAFLGRLS